MTKNRIIQVLAASAMLAASVNGQQAFTSPEAYLVHNNGYAHDHALSYKPIDEHKTLNRVWLISIAALVAGTALDAASSMGKQETNGLLAGQGGKFGAGGIGIKAGIAGGTILTEVLLRKNVTAKRVSTAVNFGEAGFYSAAAVHNFGIKK